MINETLIPIEFTEASCDLAETETALNAAELALQHAERGVLNWKGQALEAPDWALSRARDQFATVQEYLEHQRHLSQRLQNQQARRWGIQGSRLRLEHAIERFNAVRQKLAEDTVRLRNDIDKCPEESSSKAAAMYNAIVAERRHQDTLRVIASARKILADDPTNGNGLIGLKAEYSDSARDFSVGVQGQRQEADWFSQRDQILQAAHSLTWTEAVELAKRAEKALNAGTFVDNVRTGKRTFLRDLQAD